MKRCGIMQTICAARIQLICLTVFACITMYSLAAMVYGHQSGDMFLFAVHAGPFISFLSFSWLMISNILHIFRKIEKDEH